jgi:hypothetical protein
MRQRAAEKGYFLHAGQTDVAHILATAAHVAIVFLAQEPRADALLRHNGSPIRQ